MDKNKQREIEERAFCCNIVSHAAKSIGMEYHPGDKKVPVPGNPYPPSFYWEGDMGILDRSSGVIKFPLQNISDAMWLAIKLHMNIYITEDHIEVEVPFGAIMTTNYIGKRDIVTGDYDGYVSTILRRDIVIAAAIFGGCCGENLGQYSINIELYKRNLKRAQDLNIT